MFEVSIVSVLIAVCVVNILLFKLLGVGKRKNYPNGLFGVPIFGHLPFFGKSPPSTFLRWRQRYGNVFSIRMGSWKTVVVNGYKAIKEAAEKTDDAFSDRPEFMTQTILHKVRGVSSLAFGTFEDAYLLHRKKAATVLQTFTSRQIGLTEDLISEEADKLTEILLKKSESEPIDIRLDLQYAAGSLIYQILYGRGVDFKGRLEEMVDISDKFIKFTGSGNPCDVIPWLQYVMPGKITEFEEMMTHQHVIRQERIEDHVKTFSPGNIRDITDALLAADLQEKSGIESGLTRSRLVHTVADLQGAGFDTMNKSLQWLILYMAMYPEVQTRVQKEIDDVIGYGKRIELKHKPHLVYTEATILEVLRITPIAPFGLPKCTRKDTTVDGYDIDKGTVVFFNLHSVSHEKEFWGDPQTFRPERLIDDNNKLNTEMCNHILPFGVGRRRCLGESLARMQMFMIFTNVIRRCELSTPPGENYDMEPEPGLVYSPKPFRIIITERQ